ncbi:MAG: AP2/ERF family transcription factor [Bryobacterales bacterium]|nr:AP2/ERF family transcription factor [Bryobacterales bacterium]
MQTHKNRPVRGKASIYKGVKPASHSNRWSAEIYLPNDERLHLGVFDSELEAARAYDQAALAFLGPSAFLNARDLARHTEPVVEGQTALIPTSNGPRFRIDLEDLPKVREYYWTSRGDYFCGTKGRQKVQLHHLLMDQFPNTVVAVHLNGDPLDCRKENIILAPRCLQLGRQRKRKGCRSIYKGVRKTRYGTFSAVIGGVHLGTFDTEEQAAHAYDRAARKRFGICAALNFPGPGEVPCRRNSPSPTLLAA